MTSPVEVASGLISGQVGNENRVFEPNLTATHDAAAAHGTTRNEQHHAGKQKHVTHQRVLALADEGDAATARLLSD